MNVGGTRHALELAEALEVGCFQQVSSVAAAGEYDGPFDESMFDEGQALASPYHRTKFESEKLVREESTVPVARLPPGDRGRSQPDRRDGQGRRSLLLLPRDQGAARRAAAWLPLVGLDLGDTNVVPVDYVAAALDHLAHLEGRDGEAFHLVNPEPQPVVETDQRVLRRGRRPAVRDPGRPRHRGRPARAGPRPAAAAATHQQRWSAPGRSRLLLDQTLGRLGIPAEVLAHPSFRPVFDSRRTEKALAGSGIAVPDLESYARTLWGYWEDHLDQSTARDAGAREALTGKYVVITGASSGIGQVTALKVAQAGGVPVLIARGKDKLEATRATIENRGGTAYVYACDLSDLEAIDGLCAQLTADLPSIDFVVNNAGRSIRRSLRLSQDRFHDFERTMQLNYFGAIRLIMGLVPKMREDHHGHIVNISSIGVQTSPPRFSAYVASKAALDAWSNVVASELVGDGITFTSIHMPLVRTPMIAPTKIYDKFPTISPAQAADLVIKAMVERPHEINTLLGNVGAVAHTVAPKLRVPGAEHGLPRLPGLGGGQGRGLEAAPASRSRSCSPRCSRACTGRRTDLRRWSLPATRTRPFGRFAGELPRGVVLTP